MSDIKLGHYIDSMRLLPLLIFAKLLLLAGHALGAAEPYGKYLVELDANWAQENGLSVPELPAAIPKSAAAALVRTLSERLREQEYSEGPYAISLAETLDELARGQEAAGATEEARRSRERALHLIRVNDGLYSTAQRPILRAILNSLRRDEDFAALDERYDYFFRLYGSGQPPLDALRWNAVMEYLRWQREALRRGLDSDPMPRLLRLHGLNEDLLEVLTSQEAEVDFRQLAEATFSQLKTLYLVEDMIRPQPLFREQRNGFYRSDDPRDFNLQRERLESLQRMVRGSGRKLIEALLVTIPPQESKVRAQALLALADWLQWHGAVREASRVYESLWREMHNEGLEELALSWFAKPTPLPDNGVFFQSGISGREGPMDVYLSVGETGKASANVAPLSPRWQGLAIRLQRYIAATRYRPAIENGRIKALENIPVSYWLMRP